MPLGVPLRIQSPALGVAPRRLSVEWHRSARAGCLADVTIERPGRGLLQGAHTAPPPHHLVHRPGLESHSRSGRAELQAGKPAPACRAGPMVLALGPRVDARSWPGGPPASLPQALAWAPCAGARRSWPGAGSSPRPGPRPGAPGRSPTRGRRLNLKSGRLTQVQVIPLCQRPPGLSLGHRRHRSRPAVPRRPRTSRRQAGTLAAAARQIATTGPGGLGHARCVPQHSMLAATLL